VGGCAKGVSRLQHRPVCSSRTKLIYVSGLVVTGSVSHFEKRVTQILRSRYVWGGGTGDSASFCLNHTSLAIPCQMSDILFWQKASRRDGQFCPSMRWTGLAILPTRLLD